jgi:hypothetical protein
MWNISGNFTYPANYDFSLFTQTTFPVFIVFAMVCWLVNISLLTTIFVDRLHCLKRTSGWFVASIGVSSIISATAVSLFASQFVPELKVKDPTYLEGLLTLIAITTVCTSCFIIILSVERLVLTIKPMRYKVFMTQTRAKRISVLTWLLSATTGVSLLWVHRSHPEIYKYFNLPLAGIVFFIVIVDVVTFYKLMTSTNALARISDSVIERRNTSARFRMEKRFAQVVLLLLVNFVLFACPLFVIDGFIRLDVSCKGCIFDGNVSIGMLYFVSLLLQQLHATNSALFYLVLIPKYRQSWKAVMTYFLGN